MKRGVVTPSCVLIVLVIGLCACAAAERKPKPKPTPAPTPAPAPAPTPAPGGTTNPPPAAGTSQPPNSGPTWPQDRVELPTPPRNFGYAIPWAEAIVDTRAGGTGTVQIDYLRLWATINGRDTLVCASEYDQSLCGGLYQRVPWYGTDAHAPLVGYTLSQGVAQVAVNDPSVVYHWFNCGRGKIGGATHVWAEARVKITGSAAFDLGWDYWSAADGGSAKQGGSTRWYTVADCANWTVLTLGL